MKTIISDYEQQALDFLEKCNATFEAKFLRYGKHFDDDKESRDIYELTLTGHNRNPLTVQFGQSIARSGEWLVKDHNPKFTKAFADKREAHEYAGKIGSRVIKNPDRVAPTAYDLLACITKYSPGSFDNFCSEFGYDTDSKRAEKIYNAVVDEWRKVQAFFSPEEIDELQEIN